MTMMMMRLKKRAVGAVFSFSNSISASNKTKIPTLVKSLSAFAAEERRHFYNEPTTHHTSFQHHPPPPHIHHQTQPQPPSYDNTTYYTQPQNPTPSFSNAGFQHKQNEAPLEFNHHHHKWMPNSPPDNNGTPYAGTIQELDAFCQQNKLKEAVEVLQLLHEKGVTLDFPRYVMLVTACADVGVLKYAKYVHDQLIKSFGPHIDLTTHNNILHMFSKCGSMSDAHEVFQNMSHRNLTSWDTMITGFAQNGLGEDAIDLFTQFKQAGLRPDGQLFIGLFSACGVVGDVNEGMLHFESMHREYGIVPSMDHYVSVVNMLGSAGYLDEAKDFIDDMPIEPNVHVWEALMNMSRVHGNVELGDHCADIINHLDPSHLTDKSKEGLLPTKASKLMEEREKRNSSNNLPEVKNSRVHEYRAGDTSHPDNHILYTLLKRMSAQMKEAGYVPDIKPVLHDVDQETKEEALLSHSERLAVAQGLITSAPRSPIRVIKNLRICMDCHNSMKIISKIVGRELIMRDAKRFHHFKDGLCSCKDYW